MPSSERDASCDSEKHLKHQASASSDCGRAIVPMWDSSDPERAPPPLPMNPSSPIVTSRPNTSSAIKNAHLALTEKALDSGYASAATKRIEASPERSLIKGATHKRMQSLQTGHVRDLSSFIEGGNAFGGNISPEKLNSRPQTPHMNKDFSLEGSITPEKSPEKISNRASFLLENRSPEKEPIRPSFAIEGRSPVKESRFILEGRSPEKDSRYVLEAPRAPSPEKDSSSTVTPTHGGRETPTRETPTPTMAHVRPSLRRPPQSILGENTPPQSMTMQALHNLACKDVENPLSNFNPPAALVRTPQTFDAISNQILSLTSIATSLQREMANLSRRSKDNATDLVSLKEATNSRDEDIRKSLRDLVSNLSEASSRQSSSLYDSRNLYLDSKAHSSNSPGSRGVKTFTLPRIPSPNSFAASLDRESLSTPFSSTTTQEGAANIAILEKILREMGTKDGQDNLVSRLTEVATNLARDGSSTAKKLDDLLEAIKRSTAHAVVPLGGGGNGGAGGNKSRHFSFDEDPPRLELDFDQPQSGPLTQGGPVLSPKASREIPALTRGSDLLSDDVVKVIRTIKDSVAQGGGLTAEVKALVRELRGEVLGMGREIGRKLDHASATSNKDAAIEEEVSRVVQAGLDELKEHMNEILKEHRRQSAATAASALGRNAVDYQEIYNVLHSALNEKDNSRDPTLEKEDIIQAVKEAWETYKPDIEVQQFGLERDELLTCLKEGMQEYASQDNNREAGATRDEVFTAVVEGMKHFVPPRVDNEASLSRDEILDAVRECLEEFEFPSAPAPEPMETGITRDDVLDAANEALDTFNFAARIPGLNREAPQELTRDDMVGAAKEALHTFDFAATSTALSRDVQADLTRDDVLEAAKEALHTFDFAGNTTALVRQDLTRDDVLDAAKEALHTFDFSANSTTQDAVLDALKEALHSFDFSANSTALSRDVGPSVTRDDMLDAVREGLHTFDFPLATAAEKGTGEGLTREHMLDAVREGLHAFDFAANSTALTRDIGAGAGTGISRDDLIDAVNEGLRAFDFAAAAANTTALSQHVGPGVTRDDMYDAVKAGLGEMDPPQVQMDGFAEHIEGRLHEILEAMQTEFKAVSEEAKQNVAANGRDTEQLLDATKDGFETLRTHIDGFVSRTSDVTGKEAIIDSIQENFETFRTEIELLMANGTGGGGIEAVQGELEHLRETMATSLVRGSASADKDEIIEALKEGLENIRAATEKPQDRSESIEVATSEILDALQDGLTGLKAEVEKIGNKPVDMTVNYEILDTLKLGLEGVRADIDRLRESGFGETAVAEVQERAVVAADDGLKGNDLENLEILITQLKIKIEALETMPPAPPQPIEDMLSRNDLAGVEEIIRNVQESVAGLAAKDRSVDEDAVKRADFEAIETLLLNTKAKIDDMQVDPEQEVKKDHLDTVAFLISETRDSLSELTTHLEDVSKREEVLSVETLVRDVLAGLEEMKERAQKESEDLEKVTKTDVEAVEAVCLDVKSVIEQMLVSDIAALASKDDLKSIVELVKEFKGRLEIHEEKNAKQFEERQIETVGVGERVTEVKTFLEEFRDALKEKLDEGDKSVESLSKILEDISETVIKSATMSDDLKELQESIKSEFESCNAGVVGSKLESDEKFQQTWDKFDAKFEEKFNDLMVKYDDAQVSADANAKLGEERNNEAEAAMLGTKAVAEELKSFIETLGTTLTESVEKMDEASKTVFHRVEDTFTRVEETHADAKAEHQLTREQIFKAIGAVEGLEGEVKEHNPKLLEAVKDVLLLVGQHYDHTKSTADTLERKIAEIPPPPEIPALPDHLLEPPVPERYDDAPVHEKLDKLVDHTQVAEKSFAQLEMLDKMHQQMIQTAAEVSDFVSAQRQRITDDHEEQEKAAEESKKALEASSIALEKRLAQKEHIEATVVGLREEEEQLKESVAKLKAEQDALAVQKMRLSADVSSLETALKIRREELYAMEARAEGLERRIIEGVIDHSRALLMTSAKSNKGRDAMSRKRVPSHASTAHSVASSATSKASSATQSAVNMAMNGNRSNLNVPTSNPASASRRILSLSQITHNVPNGGFKRSHSVKTLGGAGALRKSSWGGSASSNKYGDLNKENLALQETEEGDELTETEEEYSEEETNRRTSNGTTILTSTVSGMTESTIDEGTEYTDDSETGDELSTVNGHEDEENPDAVVLFDAAEGGQVAA